jgi:DNA-binding transcriptional LysR family regulator
MSYIKNIHAMNLAALDLNLLVALEALLEEASVGQAADRLSLSQPAMSHALKRLRRLLDDPLLVRVGARMQLTARAEALRYPVQDALSRVRALLIGEGFEPAHSTRTFQLFVADNASDLLLPPLLKQLQKAAPNACIRVQPWRGNMPDPFELARLVDVAIAGRISSWLHQQRLFTDRDYSTAGHHRTDEGPGLLVRRLLAAVGRSHEDPVIRAFAGGPRAKCCANCSSLPASFARSSVSDLIAVMPGTPIRVRRHLVDASRGSARRRTF